MKKKIKKIIQMITLFIIGAGGKTFASDQVQVVYHVKLLKKIFLDFLKILLDF